MSFTPYYRLGDRHPQAQACATCEVRGQALFGVLDPEALDRIHVRIEQIQLGPEQRVYDRGCAGQAVYTVRAGVVRFERTTESGDRRIVRLAGRGDLIGQEALLERPYADEVLACTDVELCRIPRSLLDELTARGGALPRELMLRWQHALDATEAWVADLSTGSARRRVLHLMLRLAELADAQGLIWLPRRDQIGAMLDLTEETSSRMISRLRRDGLIEAVTPRTARLDVERLRQALGTDGA